ncbi:MAG: hypothetical protein K6B12_01660, partial [Clostridiales bacterium]|nr:hypothetical protein [Clostridiales bacterium]
KRASWQTLRGPVDAPADGWSGEEQFADRRTRENVPDGIEVVGLNAYYARTRLRLPVRDGSFRSVVGLDDRGIDPARSVADREIRRRSRRVGSGVEPGGLDRPGVDLDDLDIDLDRSDVDLNDLDTDLDRSDVDLDDLNDLDIDPEDADFDGDSWDRGEAVMAAQDNLRLMREEDRDYAMAAIEAEVLNLDHVPDEDELVAIADSAADAYDMSEDYGDY